MPTSEEIARELESFYRHYIDVFNREEGQFLRLLRDSVRDAFQRARSGNSRE